MILASQEVRPLPFDLTVFVFPASNTQVCITDPAFDSCLSRLRATITEALGVEALHAGLPLGYLAPREILLMRTVMATMTLFTYKDDAISALMEERVVWNA